MLKQAVHNDGVVLNREAARRAVAADDGLTPAQGVGDLQLDRIAVAHARRPADPYPLSIAPWCHEGDTRMALRSREQRADCHIHGPSPSLGWWPRRPMAYAAWSTRCLSKSNLPRPYMLRRTSLSR